MKEYQQKFIELCLAYQVIRFGNFTLKSGRQSPYFFNVGLFNTGKALCQLGRFYANALYEANLAFDTLFGPAYKGIPLVSATAIGLSLEYGLEVPYTFNRAVPKDHGDGGQLVGAPLAGRVILVDDVITKGTAIEASMPYLEAAGATLAGVVVSLDRQERGQSEKSAISEVSERYQVPVISIIKLDDLILYLKKDPQLARHIDSIEAYLAEYSHRI